MYAMYGSHSGLQERYSNMNFPSDNDFSQSSSSYLNNSHEMMAPREFWCETCDREFRSHRQLVEHQKQHQTCNIDGCKFVAHPSVITKHIQMQHSTGLYKKITKSNDPEEIKKWREERKKRYPTKTNIENKMLASDEKFKRGERMGLKKDKYNRNNRYGLQPNQHRSQRGRPTLFEDKRQVKSFENKKRPHNDPKNAPKHTTGKKFKLQPFTGIPDLISDSNTENHVEPCDDLHIDDDDLPADISDINTEVQPSLCGALGNLISNYGLSDDSDDDEEIKPEAVKCQKRELDIVKNDKPEEKNNWSDDDDGPPEEKKTVKTKDDNETSQFCEAEKNFLNNSKTLKNNRSVNRNYVQSRKDIRHRVPKVPSTLLYKLLAKEIKQERNLVLQCIRYISKNNFFDSNKVSSTPT